MRIGFGILAGILAGALGYLSSNPGAYRGVGIGFMIYFLSYIVAKFSFGRSLPPSDYRKMVTTGLGGYVFMFLFMWILYNTFSLIQQTG